MIAARQLAERMRSGDWVRRIGRIVRFVGLTLESSGPDARVGEICEIHARGGRGVTLAEVVGFSEQRVLLMPFGDLQGIEIGSEVIATGRTAEVAVGEQLLGRVIDGFGQPLDGAPLDAAGGAHCALSTTAQPAAPGHGARHPRNRHSRHRHAADARTRPAHRHIRRQRRRQEHGARHAGARGQGRRIRHRTHRRARTRGARLHRGRAVARGTRNGRWWSRPPRTSRRWCAGARPSWPRPSPNTFATPGSMSA